jgi:hypothetical protein
MGRGVAGLCAVQNNREMAARFLYDRIDLHHVRIEPRIPSHYFCAEVFLIAAARDRQAREPPPELSFKKIFVLH